MLHRYRLRAEYEGLDPDTTISLPPNSDDFAVGRAFQDAPDGVLALDDENPEDVPRIHALEAYFAVERIDDGPAEPAVAGVAPAYEPPADAPAPPDAEPPAAPKSTRAARSTSQSPEA